MPSSVAQPMLTGVPYDMGTPGLPSAPSVPVSPYGASAMPAAVAIPLITAGVTGTTSLIGAKMQSDALGDASNAQAKAAADTLAFNRQQAEADYRNQEVNRRANYDQYVAHQGGNNTIRAALGLKPVAIPTYVPSVDPNFTGASTVNAARGSY